MSSKISSEILEYVFDYYRKFKINNPICLAGVIMLFGFNALLLKSFISLIICINGILFHTFGSTCLLKIDLITNVFLIILGNLLTRHQPFTIICSLLVILLYKYNKSKYNNIIHVFGVQLPMAYCLYLYGM